MADLDQAEGSNPEPAEAADRRTSRRNRVLLRGKIVYGAGFTADCAIRNLSQTGACIALPKHESAPSDFHLIVVRDGIAHRARAAWTNQSLAGVVFDATYDFRQDTPAHLYRVRSIWVALASQS